jgi:hypothetical protein
MDNCHRKLAYQYYEADSVFKVDDDKTTIDPKLQRIFHVGDYAHYRWRTYFEKLGILRGWWACTHTPSHDGGVKIHGEDQKYGILRPEKCTCGSTNLEYVEVSFSDEETSWGGSVDAIVDVRQAGTKFASVHDLDTSIPVNSHIIVDFKTMNSYNFGRLRRPQAKHITQMQLYLYLSGLNVGKFVYENKDDQTVKEFIIIRDDSIIEVKKQEVLKLKSVVGNLNSEGKRVLPQRAHAAGDNWECKSCKYKDHCWIGG